MTTEFDMSDLGLMHYSLGIEVKQSSIEIFTSQKKYIQETLQSFGMQSCNSVTTPTELGLKLEKNLIGKKIDNTLFKQLVGCLMYLTVTRTNIMYFISLVSR